MCYKNFTCILNYLTLTSGYFRKEQNNKFISKIISNLLLSFSTQKLDMNVAIRGTTKGFDSDMRKDVPSRHTFAIRQGVHDTSYVRSDKNSFIEL